VALHCGEEVGVGQATVAQIASESWSGGFLDTVMRIPAMENVRVFDLAVALEPGMPRHPLHPPFAYSLAKKHGEAAYGAESSAMELVAMGAHVGTHVDARGHVAKHGRVYGDRDVVQSSSGGLGVASIEETAPIVGAGHLVNMVKLLGRDPEPADGLGAAEFDRWFAELNPPGPGSVVLVRTGWMRRWPDQDRYCGQDTGVPGVTLEGARWLSDRGVSATGSDTMAYEHRPPQHVPFHIPVHVHNLVEHGIPIMESLQLEVLAQHDVTDFLFIAVPLRIRGGTGSPIRPIAIVSR